MDGRVASDYRSVCDSQIVALGVSHHATGFPNQQRAGGYVPGRELLFPETFEAPRRHIGQLR